MKCIIKVSSPAPQYAISSISVLTRAISAFGDYYNFNSSTHEFCFKTKRLAKKALKNASEFIKEEHGFTDSDGLRSDGEFLKYDAATAEITCL